MKEIHLQNIAETKKIAPKFIKALKYQKTAKVVGLSGDLGSGKTTFTKFVAESLGIKETVNSPTFVIMKIYKIPYRKLPVAGRWSRLIHIDAYRLERGNELTVLGWNEIVLNPRNLILIEWPERVKEVLPRDIQTIRFEFVDDNKRKIKIPKN
jgi:tRNA threonylcarbamoyladenosine biosynthesis protein TsaE